MGEGIGVEEVKKDVINCEINQDKEIDKSKYDFFDEKTHEMCYN